MRPIDHLFAALDALRHLSPAHPLRMAALDAEWAAFNIAYEMYPGDPLHPARVEARERLWAAQHVDWQPEPYVYETPF